MINNPLDSNSRFIKWILILAVLWTGGGMALGHYLNWNQQVYLITMAGSVVGLLLLIRIIKILLSELPLSMKVVQFLLFSVFKLVCMYFLAITLKRFQELSYFSVLVGFTYYWMAPAIAGLICSKD